MTRSTDAADHRFDGLPGRPGKIVAIHLSYASRADQRGRRPATPSYFFKPSSSVAASGSTIERPAGTELLAFEGEIALVIGEPARRVSLADAWDHVAWVTASNDFGLYDLRANDKGSNVRSKGGDGYTPIGPELIDARAVDPGALRLRTWVNGEIAQEDTTAGLLFSFAHLVADLSQHVTLETGDVILTGTPAGSSVVGAGDVVEVEVDAPTLGLSSGRLVTTVVQGETPFDGALGSLPAVDDAQRADAWGTAQEVVSPLSPELREKLLRTPVAGLSAQLRKRGLNNVTIDGVRPMHPGTKIVGTAKTLRFVPGREDLFASHGGGYNASKRAFDAVAEGEIIVIEARGETGSGTLGDVLALRAHVRGAAGIVTDGGVRDADAVAAIGIPIYSSGSTPGRSRPQTRAVGSRRDHRMRRHDRATGRHPGRRQRRCDRHPTVPRRRGRRSDSRAGRRGCLGRRAGHGGPSRQRAFPLNSEWRARYDAWRQTCAMSLREAQRPGAAQGPGAGRVGPGAAQGPRAGATQGPGPGSQSKSQRAYHWIKGRIAAQEFTPGYRLVLGSIAGELEMSVVPVREAIRQLEAEGLVTFERNVGAHVSMVDDSQYRASMQALSILEGAATALAARALTTEDVRRARAVNDLMVETLDHFDPRAFTALNQEFHGILFAQCANPRMLELVNAEWARLGHLRDSTFTFVPGRAAESVREHESILQLIENGAPLGDIEKAARRHRVATLDAYLIHEHPDEVLGLPAF